MFNVLLCMMIFLGKYNFLDFLLFVEDLFQSICFVYVLLVMVFVYNEYFYMFFFNVFVVVFGIVDCIKDVMNNLKVYILIN